MAPQPTPKAFYLFTPRLESIFEDHLPGIKGVTVNPKGLGESVIENAKLLLEMPGHSFLQENPSFAPISYDLDSLLADNMWGYSRVMSTHGHQGGVAAVWWAEFEQAYADKKYVEDHGEERDAFEDDEEEEDDALDFFNASGKFKDMVQNWLTKYYVGGVIGWTHYEPKRPNMIPEVNNEPELRKAVEVLQGRFLKLIEQAKEEGILRQEFYSWNSDKTIDDFFSIDRAVTRARQKFAGRFEEEAEWVTRSGAGLKVPLDTVFYVCPRKAYVMREAQIMWQQGKGRQAVQMLSKESPSTIDIIRQAVKQGRTVLGTSFFDDHLKTVLDFNEMFEHEDEGQEEDGR